jgi:hypothetical protein
VGQFEKRFSGERLYFAHDNFARIDQTLRVTAVMEAGISDDVSSLEENRATD